MSMKTPLVYIDARFIQPAKSIPIVKRFFDNAIRMEQALATCFPQEGSKYPLMFTTFASLFAIRQELRRW